MAEEVQIVWKLFRIINNYGSDLDSKREHLAVVCLFVISYYFRDANEIYDA